MSVMVSHVHMLQDGGRLPVQFVRQILSGFDTKAVILLSDERCTIDKARMDAIVKGFGYNLILRQYVVPCVDTHPLCCV